MLMPVIVVIPMISMAPVSITLDDDHLASLPAAIVVPVPPMTVTFDNDHLWLPVVVMMAVAALPDHDDLSSASFMVTIPAVRIWSHAKGDEPD